MNVEDPLSSEGHFGACLKAYNLTPRAASFHYDLLGNFLFVPFPALSPGHIFEYVHELAHAQLGNGVLGMTLQTLGECLAYAEKELIPYFQTALGEIRSLPNVGSELYRDLLLFGEPRRGLEAFPPKARSLVIGSVTKSYRALKTDPRFDLFSSGFSRMHIRVMQIIIAWERLQEGIAVVSSLELATSHNLNDDDSWEAEAVRRLTTLWTETPKPDWPRRLADVARLEQERWDSGRRCDPKYLEGYRLCRETSKIGGFQGVWIAALAASHFPYHACDLLDADKKTFDGWLLSGPLDFEARLRRIVEEKVALQNASHLVQTSNALSNELKTELLKIANGGCETPPISKKAVRFWSWQRDHLWNSRTMGNLIKANDGTFGKEYDVLMAELDDDRRNDFAIPTKWEPPIIVVDQRIFANSESEKSRAKRRFVQAYEVGRTAKLLTWFKQCS